MKIIYIIGIVVVLIVGAFFIFSNNSQSNLESNQGNSQGNTGGSAETKVDWRDAELVDVRTGEKFSINQFDKPILLESFAVWCPTCTKQQTEIKKLHDEVGDTFISISLDTDPNEDKENVLEHIERNGFNWFYVISPREVTESLIAEFGIWFVNAPQAPVVLICQDGTIIQLKSGVKSPSYLKKEISKC